MTVSWSTVRTSCLACGCALYSALQYASSDANECFTAHSTVKEDIYTICVNVFQCYVYRQHSLWAREQLNFLPPQILDMGQAPV